jgi:hypothetical protein
MEDGVLVGRQGGEAGLLGSRIDQFPCAQAIAVIGGPAIDFRDMDETARLVDGKIAQDARVIENIVATEPMPSPSVRMTAAERPGTRRRARKARRRSVTGIPVG